MLDEGTVHLGGELQKSLQILDQAVDISGYVNSNHVWTRIKEASCFESQSRI